MLRIEFKKRQWKNDACELEMREFVRDIIKKEGATYIHKVRECIVDDETKIKKIYAQFYGILFFTIVFLAISIASLILGHIIIGIASIALIYPLYVKYSWIRFRFNYVKNGLDILEMTLEEFERMRM